MAMHALKLYLESDLKKDWFLYCEQINMKPSLLLRKMINRRIKNDSSDDKMTDKTMTFKASQNEKEKSTNHKKVRVEIRLNEAQLKSVKQSALDDGYSVQQWIIETIRARLKGEVPVASKDIYNLAESNYHLHAIGVNLNQIARVLNLHHGASLTTEQITQVTTHLKEHTDMVYAFIRERAPVRRRA